jgi:hypothetical protein
MMTTRRDKEFEIARQRRIRRTDQWDHLKERSSWYKSTAQVACLQDGFK